MIQVDFINNTVIPYCVESRGYGVLATGGIWDLPLLQQFYDRIVENRKNSYIVIDIGANIGAHSFIPYVDNRFTIHAIEPVEQCYDLLNKNKKTLNLSDDLLKTYNLGIMDVESELEITIPNAENIHWNVVSTFGHNPHRAESYESGVLKQKVKCITLDTFVEQTSINSIDAIKIDVEGAENMVLKGGFKTLQKYKPLLLVEFENQNTLQFGYYKEDIIHTLNEIGYTNITIVGGCDLFCTF